MNAVVDCRRRFAGASNFASFCINERRPGLALNSYATVCDSIRQSNNTDKLAGERYERRPGRLASEPSLLKLSTDEAGLPGFELCAITLSALSRRMEPRVCSKS